MFAISRYKLNNVQVTADIQIINIKFTILVKKNTNNK